MGDGAIVGGTRTAAGTDGTDGTDGTGGATGMAFAPVAAKLGIWGTIGLLLVGDGEHSNNGKPVGPLKAVA